MDEVRQVTQRLQDHRLVEEHSEHANITSSQVCISQSGLGHFTLAGGCHYLYCTTLYAKSKPSINIINEF